MTLMNNAFLINSPIPVLLCGSPGTGKTATVVAAAREAGLPVEVVIASIREPADFLGLPVRDGQGVRWVPPDWAVRLAQAGRGVLVLDEISCAPPAVQAALLRVVCERHVGELELPAEVTIIAIANPPEQAAGGWELSPPLANRFRHIQWRVTPEEWSAGLLAGWGVELKLDPQLAGIVAGFVRVRPALLLAVPKEESARGGPWPSPRSWTNLLLAATAEGGSKEALVRIAPELVGEAAALELAAYVREADLPVPEDLLAGKAALPERGDRVAAALSAVLAAVASSLTLERWQAAWKVHAACRYKDVALPTARELAKIRKAGWPAPAEAVALAEVMR